MAEHNSSGKKMLVDISTASLIKILFLIAAIALLFYLRDIFLIVFVALILASAFDPWVDWFHKHRLPRSLGILIIYIIMIVVVGGVIYLIIPPIAIETKQLSNDFPYYWSKISGSFNSLQDYSQSHGLTDTISGYLKNFETGASVAAGGIFGTISSFFGGVVSFVVVLVITFYMTVEEQAMKRIARSIVPVKYQPYFTHLINRMQEKIGQWFRGQLLLSLIIFLLSWIGLTILGVRYALVLALFAGVAELVPYLGPFIGAIPAVLIAFVQSPFLAVLVIILYLVIQFAENHIIVPKVMAKAVGLNPVIIIVALLIGGKVAGIVGILLAVPVTTVIGVMVEDLLDIKEQNEEV